MQNLEIVLESKYSASNSCHKCNLLKLNSEQYFVWIEINLILNFSSIYFILFYRYLKRV